jgi:hypothetical protein
MDVGMAADREVPAVMRIVMCRTEGDEVVHVRSATPRPVHDVVDFEMMAGSTARDDTALVPVKHQPTKSVRNDARAAPDAHRLPVAYPERLHDTVAGELVHQALGQGLTLVDPAASDVKMDPGAVVRDPAGSHLGR